MFFNCVCIISVEKFKGDFDSPDTGRELKEDAADTESKTRPVPLTGSNKE